jgi:ribonuclease H / adenosylcobalamin/alpha-ribazole phosphatase
MRFLYFDGGFKAVKGIFGRGYPTWGWSLQDLPRGEIAFDCGMYQKISTNNVAEYLGLTHGLIYMVDHQPLDIPLVVNGDSLLVINTMKGLWHIKNPGLIPLHTKARELASKFTDIKFQWVPRDTNIRCDELTHIAQQK